MLKTRTKVIKNLELMEKLRIQELFFPERYKQHIIELEKSFAAYPRNKNNIYRLQSGNCGTECNRLTFKSDFLAIEFNVIAGLNNKKVRTTYSCNDSNCSICSSFRE